MSKLVKYLITTAVGLLLAFYVAYTKGVFSATEPVVIYHILVDSFFVPAVLITGMGALVFVSNEGAFDGLGFALKSFFGVFRRDKKKIFNSYYDYKQSKGERNRGFAFMLITGLGFMAVSGIMLLLYENCL